MFECLQQLSVTLKRFTQILQIKRVLSPNPCRAGGVVEGGHVTCCSSTLCSAGTHYFSVQVLKRTHAASQQWHETPAATVHSTSHTSRNSRRACSSASGTSSTGAASRSGTAAAVVLPQLQEVMRCVRHATSSCQLSGKLPGKRLSSS